MKFEWMKGIVGDSYTEEMDKKVSEEIGKLFVSKADFNTKNEELKTAREQLVEANETIDGFKAMDIESIKKAADDWKQKAEKAESDAAAKISQIQFDARLDAAILSRRGRNTKAIKAMLDIDALQNSQNQDSDITAALDELAKESGYMFETTQPDNQEGNPSAGGIRLSSGGAHGGSGTPDYNNMSDAEYYAAVLKKK